MVTPSTTINVRRMAGFCVSLGLSYLSTVHWVILLRCDLIKRGLELRVSRPISRSQSGRWRQQHIFPIMKRLAEKSPEKCHRYLRRYLRDAMTCFLRLQCKPCSTVICRLGLGTKMTSWWGRISRVNLEQIPHLARSPCHKSCDMSILFISPT